jgi:hypothetical protein
MVKPGKSYRLSLFLSTENHEESDESVHWVQVDSHWLVNRIVSLLQLGSHDNVLSLIKSHEPTECESTPKPDVHQSTWLRHHNGCKTHSEHSATSNSHVASPLEELFRRSHNSDSWKRSHHCCGGDTSLTDCSDRRHLDQGKNSENVHSDESTVSSHFEGSLSFIIERHSEHHGSNSTSKSEGPVETHANGWVAEGVSQTTSSCNTISKVSVSSGESGLNGLRHKSLTSSGVLSLVRLEHTSLKTSIAESSDTETSKDVGGCVAYYGVWAWAEVSANRVNQAFVLAN